MQCDKIERTIKKITENIVDMSPKKISSRKKKINNSKRASPRTTPRENKSGTSLMSPRYCPPPPTSSTTKSVNSVQSQTTKYPRQAPRQKTVYTNFSRAPRFSWQKHTKLTKNLPVDITHKSRIRNDATSPSPCAYNVPTSFSPYTEEKTSEKERRRRSETKSSSSSSVSKKLNLDNVSRTDDEEKRGPPPPGVENFQEEEDEVSEFVKSSVKGKTFKMWESSSSPSGQWTDKQGYSRSGRWVTVRSKEDRKQKSKRKGISYMAKMQNTTFDEQNLARLFDQIDVNGDKAVSGEELRNFLHEERDRPAGKALLR